MRVCGVLGDVLAVLLGGSWSPDVAVPERVARRRAQRRLDAGLYRVAVKLRSGSAPGLNGHWQRGWLRVRKAPEREIIFAASGVLRRRTAVILPGLRLETQDRPPRSLVDQARVWSTARIVLSQLPGGSVDVAVLTGLDQLRKVLAEPAGHQAGPQRADRT